MSYYPPSRLFQFPVGPGRRRLSNPKYPSINVVIENSGTLPAAQRSRAPRGALPLEVLSKVFNGTGNV